MSNCSRFLPLPSSLVLAALVAFGPLTPLASAAAVIWDTPTTLAGDTDVLTTGSLVAAFNLGVDGGTTTVNGVTFENALNPNYGSTTWAVGTGAGSLTFSGATLYSGDPFGVGSSPYSLLSAEYQTLLGSALWNDSFSGTQVAVTIGGLTPGQTYYVQFWSNDPRSYGVNRDTTFSAANGTTLEQNTGSGYGGLGQWVTGTFTADGTTQDIFATGTGSGSNATMINAYQLRTTAIPEPATTAMLAGAAVLGATFWRRRRRA
ncbi:PEP-CTERM sorting domain-containing protein [Horticoccus luteus]|uniref:PEP-CTERM sorting domain-containing protein n=1 Tax=Horticoccus luteus TaxID=2862869 RepID=A0A8F9TYB9_9BACT|nr:PEP-CTERM sorting domain-containing protein [Horticoccus luteus]QYM80232.1 PEP-CTERM sorting domain-containing protein [Horticoccus luteus]